MSDTVALLLFLAAMAAATLVGTALSDWLGARRFSNRLKAVERDCEEWKRITSFVLQTLINEGRVTVSKNTARTDCMPEDDPRKEVGCCE